MVVVVVVAVEAVVAGDGLAEAQGPSAVLDGNPVRHQAGGHHPPHPLPAGPLLPAKTHGRLSPQADGDQDRDLAAAAAMAGQLSPPLLDGRRPLPADGPVNNLPVHQDGNPLPPADGPVNRLLAPQDGNLPNHLDGLVNKLPAHQVGNPLSLQDGNSRAPAPDGNPLSPHPQDGNRVAHRAQTVVAGRLVHHQQAGLALAVAPARLDGSN